MTIATDIQEKGHNEVAQMLSNTVSSLLTIQVERSQMAELASYALGLVSIHSVMQQSSASAEDTLKQVKAILDQIIPSEPKESEDGNEAAPASDDAPKSEA